MEAYTTGDIREARDREQAAQAYRFEGIAKRFNGDKLAAEKYLKDRAAGKLKRR